MTTPLRASLVAESRLTSLVKDGVQALEPSHRGLIEDEARTSFADSLEIDEALRQGRDQENRWDYLLGHKPSQKIVALEPHTANNHEIPTIIKKRKAALGQLQNHLKPGASVANWFWVAAGKVDFSPIEKAYFQLAQNGITFVGTRLHKKHLPTAEATKPRTKSRR